MKLRTHLRFKIFFSFAFMLLAGTVIAQPIEYTAEGFEQPKFVLGKLAGSNMYNGQDGWLATADIDHEVNYDSILVQDKNVKDGVQAGSWDASMNDIYYAHLRRNTLFNPKNEKAEVLLDIYLEDDPVCSEVWGLDIQAGPIMRLAWWGIIDGGEIFVQDPNLGEVGTGFIVQHDKWYHTSTVIDFANMTYTVYIDNTPIYTSEVIDKVHGFAFASIYLMEPGEDKLYFDNFVVQYCAEIELSADTYTLSEQGGIVNFHLDATTGNAYRNYILLGGVSGTQPGTPLPGGDVLPLNWDLFTDLVAGLLNTNLFQNFMGTLDASGQVAAKLDTMGPLPTGLVGTDLFFAYAVNSGVGLFTPSNPISIEVVK